MINLKLAEYNSEGRFEKFLELGKDFVYGGYYILITEKMTPLGVLGFADTCSFNRDEKDPLNRFDGLFSGRTFGEGRFVLIVDDEDDVEQVDIDGKMIIQTVGFIKNITNSYVFIGETLGNLHQNPELYEKVKNNEL